MLGGPLPREGIAPDVLTPILAERRHERGRRLCGPSLLRFCDRWQFAGRARRRLACIGVGSKRRCLRFVSFGLSDRADHGVMVARTRRPPSHDELWFCDRLSDGELYRTGRRPASRLAQRRMGCRSRTASSERRPSTWSSTKKRITPYRRPFDYWVSEPIAFGEFPRIARAACAPIIWPLPCVRTRDPALFARKLAT